VEVGGSTTPYKVLDRGQGGGDWEAYWGEGWEKERIG
jgi:hypothetical protein